MTGYRKRDDRGVQPSTSRIKNGERERRRDGDVVLVGFYRQNCGRFRESGGVGLEKAGARYIYVFPQLVSSVTFKGKVLSQNI